MRDLDRIPDKIQLSFVLILTQLANTNYPSPPSLSPPLPQAMKAEVRKHSGAPQSLSPPLPQAIEAEVRKHSGAPPSQAQSPPLPQAGEGAGG
jgi:hypothetical protein